MTWFKLFYSNISSCIQNNGWSSDFFSLSRGVRQGCPLSPYLFILCAEVLANAVRKDENIRGINIANVECKLSQYADDTTMILDGSELSLSRTLLLLDNFAISSGLKINYEKTEPLWIGSTLGARGFSCVVFGFGQVLKSDPREKLHSTEWKNLYLCMNLSTLSTLGTSKTHFNCTFPGITCYKDYSLVFEKKNIQPKQC